MSSCSASPKNGSWGICADAQVFKVAPRPTCGRPVFFTFTFKITADGEVSASETAMKGTWLSDESYTSSEGTTQQTVTGEWVATKL